MGEKWHIYMCQWAQELIIVVHEVDEIHTFSRGTDGLFLLPHISKIGQHVKYTMNIFRNVCFLFCLIKCKPWYFCSMIVFFLFITAIKALTGEKQYSSEYHTHMPVTPKYQNVTICGGKCVCASRYFLDEVLTVEFMKRCNELRVSPDTASSGF